MLLALDDNNDQHGGASTHLINGLPESTVQVIFMILSVKKWHYLQIIFHCLRFVLVLNYSVELFVQNANFEEACAICLETPIIGDTIRHLPCLHKFHKDVRNSMIHVLLLDLEKCYMTYVFPKHDSALIYGWGEEHLVQFASHLLLDRCSVSGGFAVTFQAEWGSQATTWFHGITFHFSILEGSILTFFEYFMVILLVIDEI